ncbi:MAG: GntR family transcriptional regulator [Proteobacteria bacterium]|nr:GntR family transcriptional regulator [Pseudomonadota bacterium]MBU2518108.1 GntR family transcriptional regulator [Pseudomonadota bacterium]
MPTKGNDKVKKGPSRKGVAIEEAYQRIKEMLYLNQLAPGQKIHYEDMSRRLNISVTPVIQALNRLEASGLVEYVPNKGYFLGEINEQEAKELYEAREALELYLVPKVVANLTNKKLDEVRKTFARQRVEHSDQARRQFILVDAEFHLRIAKISGNEVICRLLKDVFEKIFLKYRPEYLHTDTFQGIYREHKELLDALRQRDVEKAKETTRLHLAAGAKRIVESLRAQSEGDSMLGVDL